MAERSRLGLGTAQFGLDYGIANAGGKVAPEEVSAILVRAAEAGIRVLDTAAAYGQSEAVLGTEPIPGEDFLIITKTWPLRSPCLGEDEVCKVSEVFDESLRRLRRSQVDTLMVHHADDLLVPGGERLYARLQEWRDTGRINRIGVSVYDRGQLERLFERYQFDLVQLPLNVYDQRLLHDGSLAMLRGMGVEIHARSVFLQGLLLMDTADLPAHFSALLPHHERYQRLLLAAGVSPLAAALGFAIRQPEVGVALVGVNSLRHLNECIEAFDRCADLDLTSFAVFDETLLDPRRWPAR